jgi:hypothetical protein
VRAAAHFLRWPRMSSAKMAASSLAPLETRTMTATRIIPDRGEFIDALRVLRKGRVLVRVSEISGGCTLDGAPLYSAHRTLIAYGLIREFENPQGFPSVRYYRLSERGRDFAERACENWRQRPLLQRLAVRLAG